MKREELDVTSYKVAAEVVNNTFKLIVKLKSGLNANRSPAYWRSVFEPLHQGLKSALDKRDDMIERVRCGGTRWSKEDCLGWYVNDAVLGTCGLIHFELVGFCVQAHRSGEDLLRLIGADGVAELVNLRRRLLLRRDTEAEIIGLDDEEGYHVNMGVILSDERLAKIEVKGSA
jgi:hypothetical protein